MITKTLSYFTALATAIRTNQAMSWYAVAGASILAAFVVIQEQCHFIEAIRDNTSILASIALILPIMLVVAFAGITAVMCTWTLLREVRTIQRTEVLEAYRTRQWVNCTKKS